MNAKTKREMLATIDAAREILPTLTHKLIPAHPLAGYEIEAGRANYGEGYFEIKVRFSMPGQSPEAEAFKQNADLFGLTPEDLGATFTQRGQTFEITGVATRSRKYPILASCGGKGYKFTAASVCRALGREVPDYLR